MTASSNSVGTSSLHVIQTWVNSLKRRDKLSRESISTVTTMDKDFTLHHEILSTADPILVEYFTIKSVESLPQGYKKTNKQTHKQTIPVLPEWPTHIFHFGRFFFFFFCVVFFFFSFFLFSILAKSCKISHFWTKILILEKVYFGSQILERPSIGQYWNNFGVPVLPENVLFMFFRTCWCYSEAYNTGT